MRSRSGACPSTATCWPRAGSRRRAEDLTQEAFLRLHRHLQAGHRVENVRGFVFRVAHNLWIDAARAGGHAVHATSAQWEAWQRLRPDQGPDPEMLLQRERMDLLEEALASLTDRQRQDYEDSDLGKKEQYTRWRRLKALQSRSTDDRR